MIIEKLKQIVSRVNPETGKAVAPQQEKQYLLLIFYIDNTTKSGDEKSFEILTGRKATFTFLFENLDSIDLMQSHVMSQNVPLINAITAYTFMRLCLEEHMSEDEQDEIEFSADSLTEHVLNYYDQEEVQLNELYDLEINQELSKVGE